MMPCMWWRWQCSSHSRSPSALCSVTATSPGALEAVSSTLSKRYKAITAINVHPVLISHLWNLLNSSSIVVLWGSVPFFEHHCYTFVELSHTISVLFFIENIIFVSCCDHHKHLKYVYYLTLMLSKIFMKMESKQPLHCPQ